MFGQKKSEEQPEETQDSSLSCMDRRRMRRIEKKADKKAARAERQAQKKIDKLNAKADKKTAQLEQKATADAKNAEKAEKKADKKAAKKAQKKAAKAVKAEERAKAAENMSDAELDEIADNMVSGISKVSPTAGKVAKKAAHTKHSRSAIRTLQKRGGKATRIIAALAPTIIPLLYAAAGVVVTALKNRNK